MLRILRHRLLQLSLLTALVITGCKKGFINDIVPTNAALPSDVYQSPTTVRVYFNGIYRQMRAQWASTDGSVANSTDAWGYNSVNLTRVAKGTDIVIPSSSWYYFDYQNQNREPTYRRVRFTWYFFYELINQLNTLIDGVNKSSTILDKEKPPLIAEARALRGYFYFELIREFQFTILKDPNAKGVPYYSRPTTSSDLMGNPRGTIQQTYDSINADIEFAVANLTADRSSTAQVNLNVAEGMAARIYLEQGRWADADAAAQKAIVGMGLDPTGYPDNYNNMNSPELLWVFPQTTGNGGQTLYYGTPSSFFEHTGQGYDNMYMSNEFASHFSNTDVRNTFFVFAASSTAATHLATNKFGTGSGSPIDLINGQTVDQKMIDFNETLNMMRVGEMYLIMAEAKARQNDPTAGTVLYELQKDRDPSAVASGKTGQALIDEILLERRKELYGELGIDFLDAKRLRLPIDRSNSNHPAPNNYVIPADDPRFVLKIPQQEMQANKAFTAGDQNP